MDRITIILLLLANFILTIVDIRQRKKIKFQDEVIKEMEEITEREFIEFLEWTEKRMRENIVNHHTKKYKMFDGDYTAEEIYQRFKVRQWSQKK